MGHSAGIRAETVQKYSLKVYIKIYKAPRTLEI